MDPLTAFGVASNVLQCVQFGVMLIQKSIECSQLGGVKQLDAMQDLNQQLLVSNDHLKTSLANKTADLKAPGPLRALHLANEECLTISASFINLLNDFKQRTADSKLRSGMCRFPQLCEEEYTI